MSAVDPNHVGPALDQAPNELVVHCGLAGQRHHDADLTVPRRGPERRLGVLAQMEITLEEVDGARLAGGLHRSVRVEPVQRGDHRVEVLEDARLAATQRGQPPGHQLELQLAQLVAPQDDVVGEVAGARQVLGAPDPRPPTVEQLVPLAEHVGAQLLQRTAKPL